MRSLVETHLKHPKALHTTAPSSKNSRGLPFIGLCINATYNVALCSNQALNIVICLNHNVEIIESCGP